MYRRRRFSGTTPADGCTASTRRGLGRDWRKPHDSGDRRKLARTWKLRRVEHHAVRASRIEGIKRRERDGRTGDGVAAEDLWRGINPAEAGHPTSRHAGSHRDLRRRRKSSAARTTRSPSSDGRGGSRGPHRSAPSPRRRPASRRLPRDGPQSARKLDLARERRRPNRRQRRRMERGAGCRATWPLPRVSDVALPTGTYGSSTARRFSAVLVPASTIECVASSRSSCMDAGHRRNLLERHAAGFARHRRGDRRGGREAFGRESS